MARLARCRAGRRWPRSRWSRNQSSRLFSDVSAKQRPSARIAVRGPRSRRRSDHDRLAPSCRGRLASTATTTRERWPRSRRHRFGPCRIGSSDDDQPGLWSMRDGGRTVDRARMTGSSGGVRCRVLWRVPNRHFRDTAGDRGGALRADVWDSFLGGCRRRAPAPRRPVRVPRGADRTLAAECAATPDVAGSPAGWSGARHWLHAATVSRCAWSCS
jgi:hypothetical protein